MYNHDCLDVIFHSSDIFNSDGNYYMSLKIKIESSVYIEELKKYLLQKQNYISQTSFTTVINIIHTPIEKIGIFLTGDLRSNNDVSMEVVSFYKNF